MGREARMDNVDRMLWQRSLVIEVPEDENARYLDLAGFAEGRLDPDESDRMSDWLRSHPEAAADVTAARMFAGATVFQPPPEAVVARARAIVEGAAGSRRGAVLAFRRREAGRPVLGAIARWSGLAAAMVVAGWLGFTLGMDTSGAFARSQPASDDGIMQELFGSSPAFFRDLTGGA